MRACLLFVLTSCIALSSCASPDEPSASAPEASGGETPVSSDVISASGENGDHRVRRAAFLAVDGVYNSELMAPYDVFHHTVFRDSLDYIEPFVVSPDGKPVMTFEGLEVAAHYSFATAPEADILVIPSTVGSMGADLEDKVYMGYVRKAVERAEWVVTVCDGAFPLAQTGVLDGRIATTFPGDREAFAERFPEIDVRDDVRMVVDGKYITSVGGAMSYEPAFWLVDHLWGPERVAGNAEGLVWNWDPATLPHLVVASGEAVPE